MIFSRPLKSASSLCHARVHHERPPPNCSYPQSHAKTHTVKHSHPQHLPPSPCARSEFVDVARTGEDVERDDPADECAAELVLACMRGAERTIESRPPPAGDLEE